MEGVIQLHYAIYNVDAKASYILLGQPYVGTVIWQHMAAEQFLLSASW